MGFIMDFGGVGGGGISGWPIRWRRVNQFNTRSRRMLKMCVEVPPFWTVASPRAHLFFFAGMSGHSLGLSV